MKQITKRFLSVALSLVLGISLVQFAFAAPIRGDVNLNGTTNSTDALLILKYSVGHEVENYNDYTFDVNGDYKVNSTDALRILTMSVGKDNPLTYGKKELLKFYSDALLSSYIETTAVDYSVKMEYRIGRWVRPDDGLPDAYSSYLVPLYISDTEEFKDGLNDEGLTPYECFVEPWIYENACSEVCVTQNSTGYEVVINLNEDRISDFSYISTNDYIVPYTGFSFAYGRPGFDEVWGEGRSISLNYGVITAQINFDGYVEEVSYRVPFNGSMYLVSGNTTDRVEVDIYNGEYQLDLKFGR